jgi:hypothetical protein
VIARNGQQLDYGAADRKSLILKTPGKEFGGQDIWRELEW